MERGLGKILGNRLVNYLHPEISFLIFSSNLHFCVTIFFNRSSFPMAVTSVYVLSLFTTLHSIHRLDFRQDFQCQTCLSSEADQPSSLEFRPIIDQMHGSPLIYRGADRPWR